MLLFQMYISTPLLIVFTVIHLVCILLLSIQIYYMGRCKFGWYRSSISIRHVISGGASGSEHRTIDRAVLDSNPAGAALLRIFRLPHFASVFGETKSRRSLLSGVYAWGSEISNTGGTCVTCHGLRPLLGKDNSKNKPYV